MSEPATKKRVTRCAMFLLAAAAALVLCFWNPLLPAAEKQAKNIALTTAAVYASLRVVDATLSFLQEVEVGGEIVVSGSLKPMKFLEPVDDTVERVSDWIFVIAAASALAVVGLQPVATLGAGILALGLLFCVARAWLASPPHWITRSASWCARVGLAAAVILPLVFGAGVWAGEMLTEPAYKEARATLEEVKTMLAGVGRENESRSAGTLGGWIYDWAHGDETVGGWLYETIHGDHGYMPSAEKIFAKADALFHATLTLIAIFVFRMLVLPILLLLAAWWVALSAFKRATVAGG